MEFISYEGRCALQLSELGLPMTRERVIKVLWRRGFKELPVDFSTMMELARECVGKSEYRCARPDLAPQVVDCATLLVWLYGQRGIALPRHPIAQRKVGRPVSLTEVRTGDLVFVRGYRPLYDDDPNDAVGHCGIVTERETVINAANRKRGVVEEPIEGFVGNASKFRGVRRIIEDDGDVVTFQIPPGAWVVRSSDLKYFILKVPPHKHW